MKKKKLLKVHLLLSKGRRLSGWRDKLTHKAIRLLIILMYWTEDENKIFRDLKQDEFSMMKFNGNQLQNVLKNNLCLKSLTNRW